MKRVLLYCVILMILLAAIALIAVPRIAERIAFKGSAAQKAAYKEWKTKRLHIPAEALEVKPYGAEMVEAAKAFREAWEKQNRAASDTVNRYTRSSRMGNPGAVAGPSSAEAQMSPNLIKPAGAQLAPTVTPAAADSSDGKGLSPALEGIDFEAANRELADLDPLIQSFRELASLPGYELGALAGDEPADAKSGIPIPNFLSVQTGAKLLRLQALSQLKDRKYEGALDTAALIVRSGRTDPYGVLIQQLISVAVTSIGASVWGDIVAACDDPALLRETLKRQNQLAKDLAYFKACLSPSDMDPYVPVAPQNILTSHSPLSVMDLDWLGMIREAKRRGITVNVVNPTSRELFQMSYKAQADYLEKIVLPQLASDPVLAEETKKYVDGYRMMSGRLESAAAPVVEPFLYAVAQPNFLEAMTRAQVAKTKFDLMRLRTARKIYALEHEGKAPGRMEDLVPELLPVALRDRFDRAQEKRIYGESANGYYSFGPDGADGRGALAYDATNGTMSAGDIFSQQ